MTNNNLISTGLILLTPTVYYLAPLASFFVEPFVWSCDIANQQNRSQVGENRALGSITTELGKRIEQLNIEIAIEKLQKTTLLGTARILCKVLEN